MALNSYRLGELITHRREKKPENEELPIRGVSKDGFIPPKQIDANTDIYNVFYKKDFVYNPARMELGSIAFNSDLDKGICSSLYEMFFVHRTDICLPEYLALFVSQDEFARYCNFLSSGSAREYCRFANISQIKISLPSIEEQRKIVHDYKVITDRIELLKDENKQLIKILIGTYTEMFSQFEPLMKDISLPNGWQKGAADNFYDITIGKTPPREEIDCFSYDDTDIKWVSIADMKNATPFIEDTTEKLTKEAVEKHNVKMVQENSILLSFKMTVGRVAIASRSLTTNEAIAHFPCDINNLAYTYCMLHEYNYEKLGSTSSITTAINSKIIKSMPIIIPDKETLSRFNSLANPVFKLIDVNGKESCILNKIKQCLIASLSKEVA